MNALHRNPGMDEGWVAVASIVHEFSGGTGLAGEPHEQSRLQDLIACNHIVVLMQRLHKGR